MLAVLLALPPCVHADRTIAYAVDPARTRVEFTAEGSGFFTPTATFSGITGSIHGNLDHPERSSVEVRIPVESLRSRTPMMRRWLIESGDFFQVGRFPVMTFRGSSLRAIDRQQGTFQLAGDLTVNGIRRAVVLDARLQGQPMQMFRDGSRRTGFSATTQISRADYGMGRHIPLVGDLLTVQITLEAVRTSAYHPEATRNPAAASRPGARAP
jgi:polyisoprenoid-binding protein YceI